MLVGGVAVTAAARSFPFRVFSFPAEIKIAPASVIVPDFGPHMAGWVSYKFHYTVTLPPDASMRIRYITSSESEPIILDNFPESVVNGPLWDGWEQIGANA